MNTAGQNLNNVVNIENSIQVQKAALNQRVQKSQTSIIGRAKRLRSTGRPAGRSTGRVSSLPKTSRTAKKTFSLNNVSAGIGNTSAILQNGSEPRQQRSVNLNKFVNTSNINNKKKSKQKNQNMRLERPSGSNRFSRDIAKGRDHNLEHLRRVQNFLDALKKELQNTHQHDLIGRRNLQQEIEKFTQIAENLKKTIQNQNKSIRRLNQITDKTRNMRQEAENRRKKLAQQAQKEFEQHMLEQQAKKIRQRT